MDLRMARRACAGGGGNGDMAAYLLMFMHEDEL